MLTLRIKICQLKIEKEKNNMKNYQYKRKNLLVHLINRVEKLENGSLNKQIFKCHGSFLSS